MDKIKHSLQKIPFVYIVIGIVSTFLVASIIVQGTLDLLELLIIFLILLFAFLQINVGSIVIKTILSTFVILYTVSLYSSMVMEFYGLIAQPFLLTIASITAFLAQTYKQDSYNLDLQSRPIFSSLLAITLTVIKISFIISGSEYWIAETAGMFYVLIYIILWRLYVKNSNKTKINTPNLISESTIDNFKIIYISNQLDINDYKWIDNGVKKSRAYPYIYNEAIKADGLNLNLVLISKYKDNETYDIGKIEITKRKSIPFLYMEDKQGKLQDTVLLKFNDEIKLTK